MIYITGDIHGDARDLISRFNSIHLVESDIIILLGDVGINYFLDSRERKKKKQISNFFPCRILCVAGNHEERPKNIPSYCRNFYPEFGTFCYVEKEFPNILFPEDGIFHLENYKCLMLGGAYSIDKDYRLANGLKWFKDEQMDEITKYNILKRLEYVNRIDYVFSHTCPAQFVPTHLFLSNIDQSLVDKSMEKFLQQVYDMLDKDYLKGWYFGHYHSNEVITDKMNLLYDKIFVIS